MALVVLSHHPEQQRTGALHTAKVVWLDRAMSEEPVAFFHAVIDRDVHQRWRPVAALWPSARILVNGAFALWRPLTLLLLLWNRWRARRPVYVYWHETAMNLRIFAGEAGGTWWSRWLARRRRWLAHAVLAGNRAHHLVTSRQAKQCVMQLLGAEPDAISVVYEAIASERYVPRRSPPRHARPRVAGAGLLDARKGFDRFLALAMTAPGGAMPDAEFVWYGGGLADVAAAYRAPCAAAIAAGRLSLPGYADPLSAALADVDLFLVTSRDDPFPLVALEAMAVDCPVIAMESTGTAEALPSTLVAEDLTDLTAKVGQVLRGELRFADGYFRQVAEQYDRTAFRRRWARAIARAEAASSC